jgi:hypothetical protein
VRIIGILALIVVALIVLAAIVLALTAIPDFRRYKRMRSM